MGRGGGGSQTNKRERWKERRRGGEQTDNHRRSQATRRMQTSTSQYQKFYLNKEKESLTTEPLDVKFKSHSGLSTPTPNWEKLLGKVTRLPPSREE